MKTDLLLDPKLRLLADWFVDELNCPCTEAQRLAYVAHLSEKNSDEEKRVHDMVHMIPSFEMSYDRDSITRREGSALQHVDVPEKNNNTDSE